MKKIIITSIIVLIMTIFAGTVLAKTGTVNTPRLNLRDGASTVDTNILKKLDKGVTVNIVEEQDGWYKITYENLSGYVKNEYVDINPETQTGTTTGEAGVTTGKSENEPQGEGSDDCKMISDADVYVLPLINSTKISKIKANTKITIISENGNWKYIQSEDKLGWVISSKVKGGKNQLTEPQGNQGNNVLENTLPQQNETNENTTTNSVQNQVTNNNTNVSVDNSTIGSQTSNGDEGNSSNSNSQFPKTMYVNTEAVNIRRYANTTSDIIDRIEKNTPVTVTGEQDGWYKVTWNGIKAYIKNDYLSASKK